MIPEPPDGTKLVVMTPGRFGSDLVVERDDSPANSSASPAHRWWFLKAFYNREGKYCNVVTWEYLQAMGTLHLIGPELNMANLEDITHFVLNPPDTKEVPDAPGFLGNDPDKWYLALCHQCDGREIPFALAKDRAEWWQAHTEATGHRVTCHDVARSPRSQVL